MLNELITWVLNTYLGKYLEDFNPAQLSIALVSGEVELENVPIRRDALRSFGIPVQALSGSIGKIKLQIPVRQFRTSPWCIVIERVYGVFGPKDLTEWDSEKEKQAEYEYKLSVLDTKEAGWRIENGCHVESYYSLSYSSWLNYGATLATNILENLELKINDVHLRYEDTVTTPNSPFTAGIQIQSISAQSCDSNWTPGAKNTNIQNVSFKLLELKDLFVYWDQLNDLNMCGKLTSKDLLLNMNDLCKIENHRFLINPIIATAKFKRERCKQAIRNKNRPRISCDVVLPQVKIVLNEVQYKEIVECISSLKSIKQIRSFKFLRPTIPILNNAKMWWKYAAMCHGFSFRSSEEKWKVAKDNIHYIQIYKSLLVNPTENISKEEKQFKIEMEKLRSLEELKVLRDVSCENASAKEMNLRNRNNYQGKGILYHWFPNWLGWYGNSDYASATSSSSDESYKNIEDDILTALKETIENDTFSRRDAIFANCTFALSDGSMSLISTRCNKESVMLDMEFQNLISFVEIKPKLSSYRIGISLGSVSLYDKLTVCTEFPYLIRPQIHENQKSLYNDSMSLFTKITTDADSEEPWFQLQYERSPPEHQCDYRLVIKSKSLDVVYNESTFKWIVYFFTKPLSDRTNMIGMFNQQEQRSSRLKFFKNWKSVLMGQKDYRKKWSFEINISAPRIICVENFQEKNTSVFLIDFGRFQLFKNERSCQNIVVLDENATDNDSDDEKFMTPCSTPPGSQISRSNSPITKTIITTAAPTTSCLDSSVFSKFVINNDTGLESALYSEIYDKYIINLTDLQVIVCKNRECGYACSKTSSSFHLLDKFNISLQLERRIIDTSDPEYPSITLFGNLQKIVAHINEQKITECLRILNPITFDLFKSISNSEKNFNNKSDENDIADNNELIENANTTIFQFVIGQMILEVQSREKSIAELQIIGAKAGMTKKTGEININMSVHGFLLVDAIQSFGPDFELLIASHHHVEMDSISGSLKQSEPCSPISPGSPDPNGYQRPTSPHHINKAVNDLQIGKGYEFAVENALITIDINIMESSAEMEPIQIANITFNNLDVIANQETIVELLGFGKRILDSYKMFKSTFAIYKNKTKTLENKEPIGMENLRTEISFDFHRFNILVLRSTRIDNVNIGRKVGTLTISEAKIHATLGEEVCVAGALGGIQIIDITPEGLNHQRIFSVGKDPLTDPPNLFKNDVLYTLTNEMYGVDIDDDEYQYTNALSFKISHFKNSSVVIKVRMASVWYTHCPRFIEEIYLCVKEFKQYFKNFIKSLRNKATHMAKGLVNHISSSRLKKINTRNNFGEFSLDVILSSPVLVLPRSCQSSEVLVANLGKITVCNTRESLETSAFIENEAESWTRDTYFIDVRNINLFSLDINKRKEMRAKALAKANEMYSCQNDAVAILYDTALLFQCIHESKKTAMDTGWDCHHIFLIDGSVTQNLQVSLSRWQYEQLIESLSYSTNIMLVKESMNQEREEKTVEDAVIADPTKPTDFNKISIQFSVPILKLDLKNEHNVSLIHITFQEFSFQNIKTKQQREVQVLLRSVIMEDLKCAADSKYRNMVDSSNDIDNKNQLVRDKLSYSCPDLSNYNSSELLNTYGSIPSNLNAKLNADITIKEDKIRTLKKIDLQINQEVTAENLVIYRSFTTEYEELSKTAMVKSSIDFNCLNLIISTEKWFMVFDFFGLIANQSQKGGEQTKQRISDCKYDKPSVASLKLSPSYY